MSVKSSLSNIG